MKQNNMVIGQKGVKYGLQLPAKAQAQKPAAVKPQKPASVFGVDSDDEEDVATQVARQAEKKRAAVKVRWPRHRLKKPCHCTVVLCACIAFVQALFS